MSQIRQSRPNHQASPATIAEDSQLINAARNVMRAQALVHMIKQRVERYEGEVLAEGRWRVRADMRAHFGDRIVTKSREVDLLSDKDRAEFERKKAVAARASGLAGFLELVCPLSTAKDHLQTAEHEFARRLEPHTGQRVEDLRTAVNGALWFEAYIALNLDRVAPLVLEEDVGSAGVRIH
ncbi:hypothetical protein [Paraburkholderia youngii]|uniref:hypothetical protein n=1 Tax=Paraburkholderia youngii TaxID=2782701 RepID=UPI003D1A957F